MKFKTMRDTSSAKRLNESYADPITVRIYEPHLCYEDDLFGEQGARLFIIAYCCQKTNKFGDVLNDFVKAMTCSIDELIKMCGANGKAFAVEIEGKFEGGNKKIITAWERYDEKHNDEEDWTMVTPSVTYPQIYITDDGGRFCAEGKPKFEVDWLAW